MDANMLVSGDGFYQLRDVRLMATCDHPVQHLSHTVVTPAVNKTHPRYKELHKTVCTSCMCVLHFETVTSAQLELRWRNSK